MHTAVMRARSDVRATVHTHGIFATVMAMQEEELQPTTPPQAEFVPIRTVPFIMPGSNDLADAVVKTLDKNRVVIMKNHGMLCCGKSMKMPWPRRFTPKKCHRRRIMPSCWNAPVPAATGHRADAGADRGGSSCLKETHDEEETGLVYGDTG